MFTLLRRLFWLALLGGAGYAGWTAWQRQSAPAANAPEWPPLDATNPPPARAAEFAEIPPDDRSSEPVVDAEEVEGVDSNSDAARWVEPVDGRCPEGFPIKANDNSGIFHVPGGRFYERTAPERCYARAEDAVADGYRAAKS